MATAAIWNIKGWLGKLPIYVGNPEKMSQKVCIIPMILMKKLNKIYDVIAYVMQEDVIECPLQHHG